MAEPADARGLKPLELNTRAGSNPAVRTIYVAYNINVDGWTEFKHKIPPQAGRKFFVELSEKAWNRLAKNDVITCHIGFTDDAQLKEAANKIDNEE